MVESAEAELDRQPEKHFLLKLFYPPIPGHLSACTRRSVTVNAAICLVAIRRWQLERGKVPNDLTQIVKAAGLDSVPSDLFSGLPLKMLIQRGEPLIYSVAADGVDDRAQIDSQGVPNRKGDLIFRLE